MPDYNIYVLDESLITISGGGQLDGVTQGSGVHLQGRTITLNSNAWQPITITDDDPNFQDSDGSQRLTTAQTIDGVSYAANTVVEAEYSIVLSDGTNSWTLVGFNVNNSNPVYGTVEGLAFIGGPGGFPPRNVPLTVVSTGEGPNYAVSQYATPVCFVAGTRVLTAEGERPVEDLAPGDRIATRDNGFRPVQWIGGRRARGAGPFAPVRIAAGTLGNTRNLWVSQQHRILLEGWQAQLLYGEDAVLVAAVHLVNDDTVRLMPCAQVTYFHLLFEGHEIIRAEGCWTESLYPGDNAIRSLAPFARAELLSLFPELHRGPEPFGSTAHPILRKAEAVCVVLP
jgi:hypothetical protein